jgi:DNA-binding response OmpR family regulator
MKKSGNEKKSILIVEDESAIREFCHRVLSQHGFKVDAASNGKVAQDMIKKKEYDLLLVDVRMPVMDGVELYRWLNEQHPQIASRVIFTTGSVLGQEMKDFLTQTGKPFLLKPFSADELAGLVKKL